MGEIIRSITIFLMSLGSPIIIHLFLLPCYSLHTSSVRARAPKVDQLEVTRRMYSYQRFNPFTSELLAHLNCSSACRFKVA